MTNTTARTAEMIRDEFENAAHAGYVDYGLSMTDGFYAPEPKSTTVTELRRSVPITPAFFRYGNDFTPTQEQLDEYNATFFVGTDYTPDHLDLAVQWRNGWKTYQVTGTRHAAALLRKFAGYNGFQSARLNAPLHRADGYLIPNVIRFDRDDVTGSDRFGKFQGLTDHSNAQYDLSQPTVTDPPEELAYRSPETELILNARETQSDRDAWYDMDR